MTPPKPSRPGRPRVDLLTGALAVGAAVLVTVGVTRRAPDSPAAELASTLAAGLEIPTELPVELASAMSTDRAGRHLGFDTSIYPGDDAMKAWKSADVGYEWVGYYLPAPCHKDESWSGKRAELADMGWGMAVIYVGQQTWGKTPGQATVRTRFVNRRVKRIVTRNGRRVATYVTRKVPVKVTEQPRVLPGQSCSAHLVSGTQGQREADDAIARTAAEGFPAGTVIFLDVERMDATPQRMRDYYAQWVKRVLEDGRYQPGIYAHTHNAKRIYTDVVAAYEAMGDYREPPFWIAGGKGFSPDKQPTEIGHQFAAMWQGVLDIVQEHNGHRILIDVNVAAVPSPSEHLAFAGRTRSAPPSRSGAGASAFGE